jgi:hypothetical protein
MPEHFVPEDVHGPVMTGEDPRVSYTVHLGGGEAGVAYHPLADVPRDLRDPAWVLDHINAMVDEHGRDRVDAALRSESGLALS